MITTAPMPRSGFGFVVLPSTGTTAMITTAPMPRSGAGQDPGEDLAAAGDVGERGAAVPEDQAVPGDRPGEVAVQRGHRHPPLRRGRGDAGGGLAGFQHHVHARLVAEQPTGVPAAEHRGYRGTAPGVVAPHAPD